MKKYTHYDFKTTLDYYKFDHFKNIIDFHSFYNGFYLFVQYDNSGWIKVLLAWIEIVFKTLRLRVMIGYRLL